MTLINRQQFMSELSKLLTFMFKEDRSEIIKQYNDMLDNAEDEQAMLESFGSPTRLAVAISRNYQRDERKLSVHADSKDGESADIVKVKPVIPTPGKKASAPLVKPVEQDQEAYVDIIEEIRREKAAEEGIEYKPIFFKEEKKSEPVEEEAPAQDEAPAEEETPAEEVTEEAAPAEEAPVTEDAEVAEAVEDAALEDAPAKEEAPEEVTPAEEPEKDETPEEAPAEEAVPAAEEDKPKDETAHMLKTVFDEKPEDNGKVKTVKKTNVFLLILYIIVSVPVGLVLLLLMLGIELCILCVGLAGLRVGFELVAFTFSGMSVFADVLLCFGATLGALALGVLVTWLGLWLIIVSVPGLVRGIVKLGKKLCVKEVETDE